MTEKRFIIAGGGIGGLAAALGLAQKGFASIVLEKSTELSEIGAGIQQSLEGGRRGFGQRMAGEPIRAAAGALMAGDVEHVLGAETKAAQRPGLGARKRDMGFPTEGPKGFLQNIRLHGRDSASSYDDFAALRGGRYKHPKQ